MARRLVRALNIDDLRALAKKRLPKMVFDYIDGGAQDELAMARNERAFRDFTWPHRVLRDVDRIDTRALIMGAACPWPLLMAPTAAQRLFHPRAGEKAAAAAAAEFGLPYALSTMASTTIEAVAAIHPGPKLFQVYVWRDRGLVKEGLARARAAGFTGLALTVDVPVAGARERDPRNRFSIPPRPSVELAAQTLARPGWLWGLLRSGRIEAANFKGLSQGREALRHGVVGFIDRQFDRTVSWKDAQWMREQWDGPFAIKGIAHPDDAAQALAIGASAIWVSNHGGRQLDSAPASFDVLPAIADRVARRAEVIFDGGVRRGGDVLKAIARGASAVALGRACLYGLAAGGQAGVARALTILTDEIARDMRLLGATSLTDLSALAARASL